MAVRFPELREDDPAPTAKAASARDGPAPIEAPPAAQAIQPRAPLVSGAAVRRVFFQFVRVILAGALCAAVIVLVRGHFRLVSSDLGYLNAEITHLRAPISGEVHLDPIEPGAVIDAGRLLFRVKNPRVGNQEALSQLNSVQELVDRVRTECAEAETTTTEQEEIYKRQKILFNRKVIHEVALMQEGLKLAVAKTVWTQKQEQLRQAQERLQEVVRRASLQEQAEVTMPLDGVVWSAHAQNGAFVNEHEAVLRVVNPARVWVDAFLHEKHADKFTVGTIVFVRTLDGRERWRGRVETVRAGVGRIAYEDFIVQAPPGEFARRRIAVRVKLESENPFGASQFFGIGRSVVVSLDAP